MRLDVVDMNAGAVGAARNRVLRNTYMLLAVSMLPTAFGAWLGVASGLGATLFSGWMGLILFFAGAFGLMYLVRKNQNSGMGVFFLLLFTFFMGLMLSAMLTAILAFSNGGHLIAYAAGGTAVAFFGMAALASSIKSDLSGMSKFLFIGLIMLLVGFVVNAFVGSTIGMAVLSSIAVGIFSAYLLYDLKRVMDGGETNYINATLAVYLDLFNIFQNLLALFGIFGGSND